MIGHCLDPQGDHLPKVSDEELRRALETAQRLHRDASPDELALSAVHIARARAVAANNKLAAELMRQAHIANLHETADRLAVEWLGRLDAHDVINTPLEQFNDMAAALVERAHEAAAAIVAQCDRYEFPEE